MPHQNQRSKETLKPRQVRRLNQRKQPETDSPATAQVFTKLFGEI
jgi:hypothetical protein